MKSVAIIGAGPSGLVAAKTLLHSYPKNTFSVSIFEHGKNIGGLWAVESNPKSIINPEMRTNLSQFTVCFSDLAWETLELEPPPNIYPKAWQVNRYLEKYARTFIPDGTIAFQTHVRAVEQIKIDEKNQWSLITVGLESKIEETKVFDYLIIASGFFSAPRPMNFELDDIDTPAPILHSSQYRNLSDLSTTGQLPLTGKILIVGGSHSGAEVAATIALQMSDARYSPSGPGVEPLKILHVMPHPLIAIPTFVQTGKASSPTFLPLDSLLYDISSRSDDPISFTYGHSTPEKIKRLRDILDSLMNGTKEEKDGTDTSKNEPPDLVAPYAVVNDNYVEFVRSGAIQPVLGRVVRLESQGEKSVKFRSLFPGRNIVISLLTKVQQKTGFMRVKMSQDSGEPDIENVIAVVDATGFSPSPALSFLPVSIRNAIDYDALYPRLPLLLNVDCFTSSSTAPSNLALMGFLDSVYWGILEDQSRLIARRWAHDEQLAMTEELKPDEKSTKLYTYMKELRSMMSDEKIKLPQNLFGDYPGLMEENSLELGLRRVDLNWDARKGMVSPARYIDEGCNIHEAEKTIKILQQIMDTSTNLRAFSAKAAFRALQGNWRVTSQEILSPVFEVLPTTATFHCRYPTDSGSDFEYFCILRANTFDQGDSSTPSKRDSQILVYRLTERNNTIEVWNASVGVTADKLCHTIEFNTATSNEQNHLSVSIASADHPDTTIVYSFYFAGVSITNFTIHSSSKSQPLERDSVLNFIR